MPEIKSMFDKIVARYDFLNRLLSLCQDIFWRKKMAEKVVNKDTRVVLDLATGTADSAIALMKKGVNVFGIDISFEMLNAGKRKISKWMSKNQHKNITSSFFPVSGSAYFLPFKDESFDAVSCVFGIRNMHKTEKALKEIYRVLKPEAKLIIVEFSLPEGFLKKPYLFYLKKIVPAIASLFSVRSAYEYLGNSIEGFYSPAQFVEILKKCGFKNIEAKPLSFGCVYIFSSTRCTEQDMQGS